MNVWDLPIWAKVLLFPVMIFMILTFSGCSMLTSLIPSAPTVGIEATLGDKNQTVDLGGKSVKVAENKGTIADTTNNTGFNAIDLSVILAVLALLSTLIIYGAFQIGLRTPRPLKYTSQRGKE